MRNSLFSLMLASSLYAQQLTVRSASASRVELAWTGASPEWQVERRPGSGQFEKLAAVSNGAYADEKIGAYATYHYRLRNQAGAVSNDVIVGPPPAGVNIPARLPAKVDPEKYGAQAALCNDENGDPAIAFVWTDVNGDSDNSDNTVYFVHWDRAHYSWKAPVKIGVMGDVSTQNVDPVSLACDRATGAFAISFPVAETQGVQIALSQDGGATWQATPLAADLEGAVSSTAMATANGRWLLALMSDVASDRGGVRFYSGAITAPPAQWKAQSAPAPDKGKDKGKFVPNANIALATDAMGRPLIGYWVQPEEGQNYRVLVWNPESGQTFTAADSNNQAPDGPNLRLVVGGGKMHLLLNSLRDDKDFDHSVWYAASLGGNWSAPVRLPIDGPRSTNSPFALAIDSHGRIAAVFDANSGTGQTACGPPSVSISTDGVRWTTCGLGKRTGGAFDVQSTTIGALFGPDDRLNVVWHQVGENKFGQGILLWRE